MSVRTPRIPLLRHHKPSDQGVVTLRGRDHYLGKHGSAAAKAEYDRLIAEWLAYGRSLLLVRDRVRSSLTLCRPIV